MSPENIWLRVRACFEVDDGSFPSIAIIELEPAEVGNLYGIVRAASTLVNPEASFWNVEKGESVPLDSVSNAALLVAERRAAGFAFAASGIDADGIKLPNLGFQVFESAFSIHYQMGAAWGPLEAHAFLLWLKRLVSTTRRGQLDLSVDGPPAPESFMEAWTQV